MAGRPGKKGKEKGTNRTSGAAPGPNDPKQNKQPEEHGGALQGLRQGLRAAGIDPGERRPERADLSLGDMEGRHLTFDELIARREARARALFAGTYLDPDADPQEVKDRRPDLWRPDPWAQVALLALASAAGWPEVRLGPQVYLGRRAWERLGTRRLVPQVDLEAAIEELAGLV